ncbi:Fic family protein [Helicobacter pylori]|uniref:Fic family protein n=1 Tax=Helicobacter pylori TaxID=210 RepID=UPI00193457CD|nr:Fic family protein [Helicobacter pylori]MBS3015768.1 Fic family protein [Helicobacter pylori]
MNYKELLEFNDYAMDLTIRMAHHSTAIENNPLSLAETISILTTEYIPREMPQRAFFEVKNYQNMLPFLLENLKKEQKIDNFFVRELHGILMNFLLPNKGTFKTTDNMILGASFETTPSFQVPMAMKEWCDNLNYKMNTLQDKEKKLKAILEQHILFERIHPFSDGNGRVGRVLILYSVLEQNLVPFVITKEQKEAYIKALDTHNIESLYQLAKISQEFELTRIQGQMVLNKNKQENDNTDDLGNNDYLENTNEYTVTPKHRR